MECRRDGSAPGTRRGFTVCAGAALVLGATFAKGQILAEPVPDFEDARIFDGVYLQPYGLAAANFDDDVDGYPDIVVAIRGGVGGSGGAFGAIVVFRNLGDQNQDGVWDGFDTPDRYALDPNLETEAFAVAAGHLDPEGLDPFGLPDIVVSAAASDEVFVYLNDPMDKGSFGAPGRFLLPDTFNPRGITLGYFGGPTGYLDIAVASGTTDKVMFLRNAGGTGTGFVIASEVLLGHGDPPRGVVAGEFDDSLGNGLQDAMTPDYAATSPCQQPFGNDSISALENQGTYQFGVTQHNGICQDFPRAYFSMAKGAFQGVDEDDLVASEQCRAFVDVFHGDGFGGFGHTCTIDRYQVHPNSGELVDGVATGHLNGGTRTDIVAAIATTNEVAILLGRGNGSFQRPSADSGYRFSVLHPDFLSIGWRPRQVIVVDLDLDGFGDIVATCEGDASNHFSNPRLSVLINEGFVSFPPP